MAGSHRAAVGVRKRGAAGSPRPAAGIARGSAAPPTGSSQSAKRPPRPVENTTGGPVIPVEIAEPVTNGPAVLDGEAIPTLRVAPQYPSCGRNREGWVLLAFDVSETGQPMNIQVVDADPADGCFAKAAVAALKKEGFQISKINIRGNRQLASRYKVRRIPTYIYLVDGEEVRRRSGSLSQPALRSMFRKPLF